MRRLAAILALVLLAAAARADLITERRVVRLDPGPFPGKCVLVFAPADHGLLTAALRGTPYHAAFRRARVAGVLRDGAVPGLVPVILEPADADRLRVELDRGNAIGTMDDRLRDVLYATASRAWAGPDDPKD